MLASWDLIIVVGYLVGTTLLGIWFSRKQRDTRTYFLGDRNVSWPLILTSIIATETSTVTFLSVPGIAFHREGGNLTFLQLAFGYLVGRILVAWILLPQYLRGECFSAYELLRTRFNVVVQRTASGMFLVTRTIADGLRLFLTALLLHQFTGWDMTISIVVMGVTTILYTFLGGMQAVIWTDLIQFVIYLLGAVIAGIILLGQIPGGWDEYLRVGEAHHKFRLFDFDGSLKKPYLFWAGLIGGAFFSMASHGADHLMVQRYLCARSVGQARAALVLSGFGVAIQFLLFLLIGVGLFVLHQSSQFPIPENTRNDAVFGLFIVSHLPTGMIGLIIAAVLAAAMSTLSSSLNSSAGATLADYYRPLRPNRSEEHYLKVSRGLTLFWGVAQMTVAMVALAINSPRSIVDQVLSVAGFTTGVVLGLFLLGSRPRVVSSSAALVGLIAGFVAVASVWMPSLWGNTIVAWPWFAPLGALTTVSVAWVIDYGGRRNGPSLDRSAEPRVTGS